MEKPMIICAIDTDTKGSIAKLDTTTNELTVFALPNEIRIINKKKRVRLDEEKVATLFKKFLLGVDYVFLEQQGARPAQGVASVFAFGMTYGTLIGIVRGCVAKRTTVHFATGLTWKRAMGLTSDKKATVKAASRLAPEAAHAWKLVKHTSAAEAFLIALYGAGKLGIPIKMKKITPVYLNMGDGLVSLTEDRG